MTALIVTLHVLTCLALIAVVLLQHGKGADIGAAFGAGASQTVFGSRGAGDFLTRLTTGAAIVFMLTSLTLSYFSSAPTVGELVDEEAAAEAPVEPSPEPSSFPEATPTEGSGEGGSQGDVPSGFEEIPAEAPAGSPQGSAPPPEPR